MKAFLYAVLVGAASLAVPTQTEAQLFNEPFSFNTRGGVGESVGMSTAHRQLMLERELRGRAAENPVIRDRSGALLNVERANDGQAFVTRQAAPFVPGAGRGGGVDFLDVSVGGSGVGINLLAGGDGVVTSWTLMTGGDTRYPGVTLASYSPATPPINSWIGQLSGL